MAGCSSQPRASGSKGGTQVPNAVFRPNSYRRDAAMNRKLAVCAGVAVLGGAVAMTAPAVARDGHGGGFAGGGFSGPHGFSGGSSVGGMGSPRGYNGTPSYSTTPPHTHKGYTRGDGRFGDAGGLGGGRPPPGR